MAQKSGIRGRCAVALAVLLLTGGWSEPAGREAPEAAAAQTAASGRTAWIRKYGGMGAEHLDALSAHPQGGFLAVGRFGPVAFPREEGLALGLYNADGSLAWSRVVTTEAVHATSVTLTSLGNILLVGRYRGSPDLGAGPLPAVTGSQSWEGFFIAKFSPTGQTVWTQGFSALGIRGELQRAAPSAVATDAAGSLVVTGAFRGTLDLGGGPLSSHLTGNTGEAWGEGGFVAKFSWEGKHQWSAALQSGVFDTPGKTPRLQSITTDPEGNVLLGGSSGAWMNLGDGVLGVQAPFIAKYSATGRLLWKRLFGGAYGDVMGLQAQGTGQVAFIGNFGGSFTFGGRSYLGGDPRRGPPAPPNTNGFVGQLSATGTDAWLTSVETGNGASLTFEQLRMGEDRTLTVSGWGVGEFDLGGGTLGDADGAPFLQAVRPFVARYSGEGQFQWDHVAAYDRLFLMAPQPAGGLVLGTTLSGTLELDGQPWTSSGAADLLYWKMQD
ncbi:hypothetical protein SAMN05444354_112179 [Stigmatella aurantiaca]|uniref:Uncharacterized protein n=1 Tax=Stigmatella aurantiaca TaxID=41 RepID=A0A1H7W6P1_STIAU|nr:hypothetical protein [Stigmatella aurantiaca]SEM17206.1 hypothetical protein SAMN05444354_112179 [Stigmatella aurantiaca]